MSATATAPVLKSYVTGGWSAPDEDGQEVFDASTGEVICRVSSDGIDMASVLDYARTLGGSALQPLTFHERAAMLKSLATHLNEHREELHALSARAGSTRG